MTQIVYRFSEITENYVVYCLTRVGEVGGLDKRA